MTRTLYATLVGIDAYQRPVPALNGCVNDIEAIAALLKEFGKEGDFAIELQELRNEHATRANVIANFRGHLSKAKADDVAFFYYSGHGSQESAPPEFWHIEPDHLDETLVCYDSRNDGQWDLADKELAVLIAGVAASGTHLLCVLDCCHSGSGTRAALEEGLAVRRAPTDRRSRPLESFLDGALAIKQDENDYQYRETVPSEGNWLVMPKGRHVLLAACRSGETAKEINEDGNVHGAFTVALLAALRQTRGSISYRDLVKRAEAQVRLRVAEQVPQIEANNPTDLLQPFLGGAVRQGPTAFTLRFDRVLKWTIDGGAIHGIARPRDSETTSFAIFLLDAKPEAWRTLKASVAMAEVRDLRPELSCVDVKPSGAELDCNLTYRAVVVGTPLPAKRAYLDGDAAALELIKLALADAGGLAEGSLLVREAKVEAGADFRISAYATSYHVSRSLAERPLVAEIEGINANGAGLVVDRLEHVARWLAVAELRNDASRLGDDPVKITLLLPDANGTRWDEADPRKETQLYYTRSEAGEWQPPRLRLKLTNNSNVNLYCALLWLGENYSVSSGLLAEGAPLVPGKGSIAANDGEEIYAVIPDEKWKSGRTELNDRLKLLVSREQFDPTLFEQGDIDAYTRVRSVKGIGSPRSALERLATRVHSRDLLTKRPGKDDILGDWTASDLTLTIVRPLEAAQVPADGGRVALGTGVALMGHPTFTAKVSLVSTTDVGRALGTLGTPAIFRDDPQLSQPFLFESARGTDPGLGALQLTDMENANQVTSDTPLRLRVQASLNSGEHVIPYAWDGEFYLPLGAARAIGGELEIEIRQIPAPVSTTEDVQRGITSSIRILFQKIISPYVGIEFDYPHLAAVSFDAREQPIYDKTVGIVQAKVTAANKILLYVHGILGDTLGMTAAARANIALQGTSLECIADRYDLLLAFDYENINTSIKDNARALKERLAAVGLGADHGKTLHVVAHSMGGLVVRWLIECDDGHRLVQHLVTLGTPHAGSPWPTIGNWATAALAIGLNGLDQMAWPLKLIGDLAGAVETVDVALDEMAPNSQFLIDLEHSADPKVPYTLLIGDTSIVPAGIANGVLQRLLTRLAPQRVLHDVTALAFLNKPNDIAVAVTSAGAVPRPRTPAPVTSEVACDHITFFTSDAGRRALLEVLKGI